MQTYILLIKMTEQGIKDVKNAPKRIEMAQQALEGMGGKMVGMWAVMGDYDYVAVGDIPSDEVAMQFLLGLGALGNARTTTLKAFTKDQFAEIVGKMP
jgi:uncharacterized protein with GYD domain